MPWLLIALLALVVLGAAPRVVVALSSSPRIVAMPNSVYDVVVVGGGAAGLTAAKLAGETLQKKVVIIEADKMGGDCTWTGCVPSKSILSAAKSVQAARKYGFLSPDSKPDFSKIRSQIAENIQEIYDADDSPQAMAKLGVDVISGSAKLINDSTVLVTTGAEGIPRTVEAEEGIILCAGAQPRIPSDIQGLESVPYLTSETVWSLESIPDRLTVLGGGHVGCELAQAFSRLGSKVTLVGPGLLPEEDPEAGKVMEQVFESEGIVVVQGRGIALASVANGRQVCTIQTSDGGAGETVESDQLLLAVGRTPRTTGLGLKEVGVDLNDDGDGIQVNEKLQTTVDGIYAAGDCTGDRQYTHYAGFQGAIAARNILLPLTDPGVITNVPAATFTSPEVASVGMSETQALAEYGSKRIAIAQKDLSEVDRAVCEGETAGFLKVVYMKSSGKILGATVVAPSAGEIISELSVAMASGFAFQNLAKVMHAYPAYSIALQLMAADVYYEKTLRLKPVYDILKRLGL